MQAQATAIASGGFSDILETIRTEAQRLIEGFKPAVAAAKAETQSEAFVISGLSDALKNLGATIAAVVTPATDKKPAPAPKAEEKPAPKPEPKPAPAPAPAPTYTVQSGDSLSAIAGRVLGDMNRWTELYELNRDQIPDPNVIYAGLVLKLPGGASAAPAPAPKPAAPAPTYTVQSGDSLSAIAGRVLGDMNRWGEIFELNRDQLANPNVVHAGMVLKLPGGANVAPTPAPGPGGRAPYINQYQPAGAAQGYWNGPANCGPTSMAMIARAFGYGAGMSDAKLINHLGQMGGTGANGTNVSGIAAMARGIGKGAETRGPGANVAWIAEQLRAGKKVVANGDYFAMGGHDRSRIGQGGHYVAVVGIDGNGNFLVNDPADSAINGRAFTPDELAFFIRSNSNGGYQIAIG